MFMEQIVKQIYNDDLCQTSEFCIISVCVSMFKWLKNRQLL